MSHYPSTYGVAYQCDSPECTRVGHYQSAIQAQAAGWKFRRLTHHPQPHEAIHLCPDHAGEKFTDAPAGQRAADVRLTAETQPSLF